ncbi:MAG TPA: DUF502 domain-containing protein [Burkholderiales bacterium]|nr:DUF502 domain-containing protein [Burkholderiales bacterium]
MTLPLRKAGRIFVTGLLTVLPLVLTVYFAVWLLTVLEKFFGKQAKLLLPDDWYRPGLGLIVAILLIFAVGMLMHAWLFRRLFRRFELVLLRVPLVRSVYSALRELLGLFGEQKGEAMQVVMVKMADDTHLLGFITRENCADTLKGIDCSGKVAVYLPMSYQVGGYTIFVPQDTLTKIDMSREDAMRFILTAGLKSRPLK